MGLTPFAYAYAAVQDLLQKAPADLEARVAFLTAALHEAYEQIYEHNETTDDPDLRTEDDIYELESDLADAEEERDQLREELKTIKRALGDIRSRCEEHLA